MEQRADSVREACSLFQAGGGGSIPTSALQLRVETIDYVTAKRLNRLWHSRLPEIGDPLSVMNAGIRFVAEFDGLYYAAAIWSHPVSRVLPQDSWLELRRLAVAPDAPRNTASRMLAVMARTIRDRNPKIEVLVSYQDTEVHTGAIYRGAGWTCEFTTKGHEWDNATRKRPKSQSVADKKRWEKRIRGET